MNGYRKESTRKLIARLIFALVLSIALVLLNSWFIEAIWNWLAVSLFGLPRIDFAAAFGILLLLGFVGSFFKGK